jgi:hypothetical protein
MRACVRPLPMTLTCGTKDRKKEGKTYARCQACVKGALASKSHRDGYVRDGTAAMLHGFGYELDRVCRALG